MEPAKATMPAYSSRETMAGSYYTSVQRILTHVTTGVTEGFAACRSDAHRVAFVLDLPFVDENFEIKHGGKSAVNSNSRTGNRNSGSGNKSVQEARRWRDRGNQAYQKQNFVEATECYTKALLHAPGPALDEGRDGPGVSEGTPLPGGSLNALNSRIWSSSGKRKGALRRKHCNNTGTGSSQEEPSSSEKNATSEENDEKKGSMEMAGRGSAGCCGGAGLGGSRLTEDGDEACTKDEAFCADEKEYSLALANRSAALFQSRQTEHALGDIRLALSTGYPCELEYKLYDRMGKCLLDLERHEDAADAFRRAKESLSHAKLDKRRARLWHDTVDREISLCELRPEAKKGKKEKRVTFQGVRENVPVVMGNPSKKFPCASEAFDIRCSQGRGRYAVARRQVSVGDILVAEKPYVSVLSYDLYASHCHHCLKQLVAALACNTCSLVRYCSEGCKQESWERYHSTECAVLRDIRSSGIGFMGHLALRTVLAVGLEGLMNSKRVAADEGGPKASRLQSPLHLLVDNRGNYVGGFDAIYDLVTHTGGRSHNELLQYTLLAAYLLKILKTTNWFDQSGPDSGCSIDSGSCSNDPEEGSTGSTEGGNGEGSESGSDPDSDLHVFVGSVLLHLLQIISCNGVEVMETQCGQNIQKAEQVTLGLALYPTVSLINHSCNPAMELVFYGDACVLRAIRNLADREELSIDYGYVYYLTERSQREMALKSQYHFSCVCEACKEDWPIRNKLPNGIPTFKCTSCGTPLSMYGGDKSDPTMVKCRKCGMRHKPLSYLEELQESSRLFDKALSEVKCGKTEDAIPILESHLCLMEKYLCLPWKDYITCLSTLKQCYRVLGNRSRKK